MTKKELDQLQREAGSGSATQDFIPQYADSKGLLKHTGIGRSLAYLLFSEGKIDSVCIRRPGSTRGKRLWHIPSVLAFLDSCRGGSTMKNATHPQPVELNIERARAESQAADERRRHESMLEKEAMRSVLMSGNITTLKKVVNVLKEKSA